MLKPESSSIHLQLQDTLCKITLIYNTELKEFYWNIIKEKNQFMLIIQIF